MNMITLTIDGVAVTVPEGTTVLRAAQQADIYIPHLCSHPDLPLVEAMKPAAAVYWGKVRLENKKPDQVYEGCQLCAVTIAGKENFLRACDTVVTPSMIVSTASPEIQEFRRNQLMTILTRHPHACLVCAQKEGCAQSPCSTKVPENERCCAKFGNCELRQIAEYVGIKPETPRYLFENRPIVKGEPLFYRNYNLCIGCTRCVRVCREVRGVAALDFIFDEEGRVVVGPTSPTLQESGCHFCTACVAVCPTGALMDKEAFQEAPCQTFCPAGIDVPRYVRLVNEGKSAEATAVIREKVPFPRILGYVCPHPCELKCRRAEVDEPIAIRALKRFAAEHDDKRWRARLKPVTPTGKKVAVIGSGPAGLSAAYYLTRLGHSVTIFEAAPQPGGMMQTGIPRFLLPQEVLDEEIGEILSLGAELRLNSPVENTAELFQDGYQAILLAVGLPQGRKLPLPGNDLEGVLIGLDFLREASAGKKVKLGQNVLVLGGGGVACDVARTARRLGAPQVAMACLEPQEALPAPAGDIQQTEEEGIKIFPARSFKQILGEDGRVKGVACQRVQRMEFDQEGRLHLETFPDSEHVLAADTVIFAVGQSLNRRFVEMNGIKLTERGQIKASLQTLETNQKGLFVSGEATTGPASIVTAIASGRKAASSIDQYLGGQGVLAEELSPEKGTSPYLGREEDFSPRARVNACLLPVAERLQSFAEVESTLSAEEAITEASRCLRCDLRLTISPPVLPPRKKHGLEFTLKNVSPVPAVEGVYQLLDEQQNVIYIKGAMNLHRELAEQLTLNTKARYFVYEEEPMFTKKESEVLQHYLAEHGQMPAGNRELEDLF